MQSLMRLGMSAVASTACCAAVSAGDVAIQDLTPVTFADPGDFREVDMMAFDASAFDATTLIQVAAPQAISKERLLKFGACELHPTADQMKSEYYEQGYYALHPRLYADSFFFNDFKRSTYAFDQAQVEVTRLPEHGRLSDARTIGTVDKLYSYYPNTGFTGKDRVEFLLTNKDGIKANLTFFIRVDRKYDTFTNPKVDIYPKYCPIPNVWKISQSPSDPTSLSANDLAAWQRASNLSALLASASQSLTSFADLPAHKGVTGTQRHTKGSGLALQQITRARP